MKKVINVAFCGNPNVGKTALINAISGAKLKIGNWPGVTVERKEAEFSYKGYTIKLVDLPGIYSLTPFSEEEKIAQNFLLDTPPDVIVNVVDATNLERNLFLTTQLIELNIPTVIALNMWDDFVQKGYSLNIKALERILRVKIVKTVAVRGKGLENLLDAIVEAFEDKITPAFMKFSRFIEIAIERVIEEIRGVLPYPERFSAIKLIEGDKNFRSKIRPFNLNLDLIDHISSRLTEYYRDDIAIIITEQRYGFVNGLLKEVLRKPPIYKKEITDILDSILLNKILGIPVFLFLMYMVFKLTFNLSAPFVEWIDGFFNGFIANCFKYIFYKMALPDWLSSILVDGVLSGVGLVLSFVPIMFLLYFFLAFLEESGYMARAAYVMDELMHKIGLHGKAFIPMVVGFGCNVPGILATRILDNDRDRKLVALLVPFMSCSARLPVYALFATIFFAEKRALVVFSMYIIGILVALIVGNLLKHTLFRHSETIFIMELPAYRIPTFKMLFSSMWLRTISFIKKAGVVITFTMVILWFLLNLPYNTDPGNTYIARASKKISFLFKPAGFGDNWQAVAAAIPGTVAKEIIVAALAQFYSSGKKEEPYESIKNINFWRDLKEELLSLKDAFLKAIGLKNQEESADEIEGGILSKLKSSFDEASAFSYMVFTLLWIPCIATLSAIYKEFGFRLVFLSISLNLISSWVFSVLIYNIITFLN